MIKHNALNEIRLHQVQAAGWLRNMLEKQRDGFPGHLDEIGYPFDRLCWQWKRLADGGLEEWYPYEQTAYWIDAMLRASLLFGNEAQIKKYRAMIDAALDNAEDGFIGPKELRRMGPYGVWPHAVFFRALYALWSATGEEKYLRAVERHYMQPENQYVQTRNAVNIETMLRVAEQTDNAELLSKARENYRRFQSEIADTEDYGYRRMLTDAPTSIHGVTLNELGKLPAMIYTYFGETEQLQAAEHLYEKILRDHMLADGVHSSTERTSGNDMLQTHESCDISDFTWSLGYLLEATGDAKYADLIERAIFNAAPGAIGPHFRTVQYFSGTNQVRCGHNSSHVAHFQDTPRMAFQPHHYPECCVSNIGRAFPNYIARMYWEDQEGVVCALYGDSRYAGKGLTLVQTGNYPFHDTLTFTIHCDVSVETTLKFRIPAWCEQAELTLNDHPQPVCPEKGFAALYAVYHDGDVVQLRLPMGVSVHSSPDGGVYFDYGPLLLALKVQEHWEVDPKESRQTRDFPAYNVEPASEWRYAVTGRELPQLISRAEPANPWWDGYPMTFALTAYKLPAWDFVRKETVHRTGNEGVVEYEIELGATMVYDDLVQTPPLPQEAVLAGAETVALVPYGCTNLRIAVFPRCS